MTMPAPRDRRPRMSGNLLHGRALVAALLCCASASVAHEPAHTMQSAAERALERPAGPWQGEWLVLRDDPRIRTRAGAEALRLSIVHDRGRDRAQVAWAAGRAICDDVMAEPCEWVGARGEVEHALVAPEGLYLRLAVSADASNPLLLHLPRPVQGAAGVLFDDDVSYRVELEREP